MLHCRIRHDDINVMMWCATKAGDDAKMPLCVIVNGTNKISL